MTLHINFNADRWQRSDALLWIFFSDWEELETDAIFFNEMANCINALILDKTAAWPTLPSEDKVAVMSIISKLKTITPAINKTNDANTLLWIRFAFTALRNGLCPSNTFMNAYARWRYKLLTEEPCRKILRLVEMNSNNEKSQNTIINGEKYESYSLDRFFITKSIQAVINSPSKWLLSPLKKRKTIDKKKRSIKDIVGQVAYRLIQESIIDAAKYKKIRGLLNIKIEGRYKSEISRDNLAIALMTKYKTISDIRKSTIIRTISEFAACPNYRKNR